MKKVINGKMYDTKTARFVAGWDNGYYTNDFNYCSEDLYCKRTGEYFIHGEGGAMSIYSESVGNGWTGSGEAIIPISYEDAKKWMEEHTDGEAYEAEFSIVADDDKALHITIKSEAWAKINKAVKESGRSIREVVEDAIAKY